MGALWGIISELGELIFGRSTRGAVVKALDCYLDESQFEFTTPYYVLFRPNTFWEMYELSYLSSSGLNRINSVLLQE